MDWTAVAGCVVASFLFINLTIYVVTLFTMPPSISLKDKHVLVVGGSSGIGLAIAKLARIEGALVSIVARTERKLESAKEELDGVLPGGAPVFTHSADVSTASGAQGAVDACVGNFGPLDALICCQGSSNPLIFSEASIESLEELMRTNFSASLYVAKAALPSMLDKGSGEGRICFISSQAGQVGVYGYSGYAAAKFALRGMAEVLQQELCPFGIRVSLVFPPDTDTPQLAQENLVKSTITKKISASAPIPAIDVARSTIRGIKRGLFSVTCSFEGFMLGIATAGMSPQPSFGMIVMEVLLGGLMRMVAVFTLASWFGIVRDGWKDKKM